MIKQAHKVWRRLTWLLSGSVQIECQWWAIEQLLPHTNTQTWITSDNQTKSRSTQTVTYVTVFAKRDHLGANLDFESCIWSECALLPLYNAFHCVSLAGSVSEIYLRKVWNYEKCIVEKITFKHLLPVKPQHSVFFRVTEHADNLINNKLGPVLLLGHMSLHWTLWKTSWSHRNWRRLFLRSCEDRRTETRRA